MISYIILTEVDLVSLSTDKEPFQSLNMPPHGSK